MIGPCGYGCRPAGLDTNTAAKGLSLRETQAQSLEIEPEASRGSRDHRGADHCGREGRSEKQLNIVHAGQKA